LSNQFAMGHDEYPEDVTSAYSLLVNYKSPENTRARAALTGTPSNMSVGHETTRGITFAQQGFVAGTNGVTHTDIECFGCNNMGHYASNCPSGTGTTVSGTTLLQYAFVLAQANVSSINPAWILLDSQSTVSVFNNAAMLTNIKKSEHVLRALTNGGYLDSDMVGDFHNLGAVWYNPGSIANIFSLVDVRRICRVTMNTSSKPALCVHRLSGSVMKFIEHGSGLYVYDSSLPIATDGATAYTMASTVADQNKLF
jgi:hypothetical protein